MGSVGSSYTTAYHMTSQENVDNIVANGFDMRRAGSNADVWGAGVYFTDNENDRQHWENRLGNGGVRAQVDTKGFLPIIIDKDYGWQDSEQMYEAASKGFNSKQRAFYQSELKSMLDRGWDYGAKESAFMNTVRKFNVPGLKITSTTGTIGYAGGNQIIVYDKGRIHKVSKR